MAREYTTDLKYNIFFITAVLESFCYAGSDNVGATGFFLICSMVAGLFLFSIYVGDS